jgi:hypothetical protein
VPWRRAGATRRAGHGTVDELGGRPRRGAFGVGDFPLRINTIDADGVALAAVKALEARTRGLRAENDALKALDELRRELRELKEGRRD